jgi:hypothetical protein
MMENKRNDATTRRWHDGPARSCGLSVIASLRSCSVVAPWRSSAFTCVLFAALRFLFVPLAVYGQDTTAFKPSLHASGYLKFLHGASWVNDIDQLVTNELFHHRLDLQAELERHTTLRVGMRNRFFYGEAVELQPDLGTIVDTDTGRVRMSILWVDEPGAVLLTTFDRAVLSHRRDKWEAHIGRQRINWGLNNVWNPNDLFNAFNYLDFDYEERPGSDAVRTLWFPSSERTLEVAYARGNGPDDHIGAALYKFNRSKYDYQVLAGLYRTDLVLGGGWAGHIQDAGFKGEASWFLPKDRPLDSTGVFTASVMADRTFGGNWYLSASYLYNSLGNAGPEMGTDNRDLTNPLLSLPLSAKQLLPFQHTFFAGANKAFSPITGMNVAVLYSPHLNTMVFFPTFTWNVATGFDLDLTMQSFWNDNGLDWNVRGNAAYLRIRWSY